jgi:hypothetical protein
MGLETFDDLVQTILGRADEIDAGGTASSSPFYGLMDETVAEVHRDLVTRHPWLDIAADPPGAFVTTDDITTTTLTIAAAGVAVAGTLSAAPSASITGRKIRPSGVNWIARITAHTAGQTGVTLDAVPAAIAAGTACVIFQDEYEFASDLGVFMNGLWDQAGHFVPLVGLETLVAAYPDPPGAATTAACFARLTKRKIRLAQYPNSVRRYEYPYLAELSDPSGAGTLSLPSHLRPALAEGALALLWQMKGDKRQAEAVTRYEQAIERAIAYDTRRRLGWGQLSQQTRQGGYADTRR